SLQVRPMRSGPPCAMVYGLSRALPGVRALIATVTRKITRELDLSVGRSGPHDFTVRFDLARPARPRRPSHPAANVRDDRDTPLLWRRDGRTIRLICISGKAKYFHDERLTGIRLASPTGKSVVWMDETCHRSLATGRSGFAKLSSCP